MSETVQERLASVLSGRYRIESELGRGGMATVMLAEDLKHHRPVAIKVLSPEVAAAIGPERFLREITTVAQLSHPHILPLHDSGEAGGLLYYVMPYVTGESLRERLAREHQLPLEDALRITREVADALGHAHARDVVHRDIKPGNILLEAGHAVVADFGIARAVAAAGGDKLTATGVAVGTPGYMSPEQVVGGVADSRSDIYALGCVLYEMLAGQPPFTGPTAESVVFQHLNAAPPRVTAMRPAVPAGLDRVIAKAMAKSPADRYATTQEFGAALTAALGAASSAEAAPSPPAAWRRLRLAAMVAAVVAVVIVVLAARQQWWPFGGRLSQPAVKKDWILVAEFDGPAADSATVMAARDLLSTALDQSRIVQTVQQTQIRAALAAAGKPRGTRLSAELAREIAYRSSVRAVLEGSLGRLGSAYTIVARVVDADSARVILSRSATAKDDRALIRAVEDLAKDLRKGLGENSAALRATRPMNMAMTPSFDAYRLYVQAGRAYRGQTANREAIRLLRAALSLDPDFVAAWHLMALMYFNLGQKDSSRICYREELRRTNRLTPEQRARVDLALAGMDGDDQRVRAALDRILAEDPDNVSALTNSNDVLWRLGRGEEALARTQKAMRLAPFGPNEIQLGNETLGLVSLGRFDEARESARGMAGTYGGWIRGAVELAAGRFAVAESLARADLDDPRLAEESPEAMRPVLAAAQFGRGAAGAATVTLREIDEVAGRARYRLTSDTNHRAWIEFSVLSGGLVPLPPAGAWPDTTAMSLLSRGLSAAVANDRREARRCLEAARARPRLEFYDEQLTPALLAARVAALEGRLEETVRLLRPMGGPVFSPGVSLTWIHWWLADAFERMDRPDSAAFYLERAGTVAFAPYDGAERPYLHRRLALLYARMGRVADAQGHLAAAEKLWDRSDPEVRRMVDEARAAVASARAMAKPEHGGS